MIVADPFAKNGWRQCHACGCTYPLRDLRTVVVRLADSNGTALECLDGGRCRRFKAERLATQLQQRKDSKR